MLAGNRDRPGNRKRQRAAHADRAIENAVDPPQNRAAESGQAMLENLVDGLALVDAAHAHRFSLIVMHSSTSFAFERYSIRKSQTRGFDFAFRVFDHRVFALLQRLPAARSCRARSR